MSKLGRVHNKVIKVPFFKEEDNLPEMPKDLKEILETAISVQTQQDLKLTLSHDTFFVEQKLRDALSVHKAYIESLPAAEESSRDFFMNQLTLSIAALKDKFEERKEKFTDEESDDLRNIRVVSLDFNRQDVNSTLMNIANNHSEIKSFLQQRQFKKMRNLTTDDDNKQDRFINKAHCTFAHAMRNSQEEMKTLFGHIIGVCCEVSVNAILFDDEVAALEVSIPDSIPESINEFTHITIWCREGTKAYKSNNLPMKVKDGSAKRIELESPIKIQGEFSYWY